MNKSLLTLACLSCTLSTPSLAGDMRFGVGLSYATGVNDVVDYYEENLEREGYEVDASAFPLGISHTGHYQFDGGMRLGYGVGPGFVISGDIDHVELPLQASIGYTFAPSANTSPYIFAGPTVHFLNGDHVNTNAATGAIIGVGIEFARNSSVSYVLEIAKDTTKVDFEQVTYGYYSYYINGDYYSNSYVTSKKQSIETYDTVVSFRVLF